MSDLPLENEVHRCSPCSVATRGVVFLVDLVRARTWSTGFIRVVVFISGAGHNNSRLSPSPGRTSFITQASVRAMTWSIQAYFRIGQGGPLFSTIFVKEGGCDVLSLPPFAGAKVDSRGVVSPLFSCCDGSTPFLIAAVSRDAYQNVNSTC